MLLNSFHKLTFTLLVSTALFGIKSLKAMDEEEGSGSMIIRHVPEGDSTDPTAGAPAQFLVPQDDKGSSTPAGSRRSEEEEQALNDEVNRFRNLKYDLIHGQFVKLLSLDESVIKATLPSNKVFSYSEQAQNDIERLIADLVVTSLAIQYNETPEVLINLIRNYDLGAESEGGDDSNEYQIVTGFLSSWEFLVDFTLQKRFEVWKKEEQIFGRAVLEKQGDKVKKRKGKKKLTGSGVDEFFRPAGEQTMLQRTTSEEFRKRREFLGAQREARERAQDERLRRKEEQKARIQEAAESHLGDAGAGLSSSSSVTPPPPPTLRITTQGGRLPLPEEFQDAIANAKAAGFTEVVVDTDLLDGATVPQGRSIEEMTVEDIEGGVSVKAPEGVASRLWFYKNLVEEANVKKPNHQKQPWEGEEGDIFNATFELSNLDLSKGVLYFALVGPSFNQLQAWRITTGGSMSFSYPVSKSATRFTPLILANNSSFDLKDLKIKVSKNK